VSEHGEHAVCIAVPVELLRQLITLAAEAAWLAKHDETVKEAEALLPRGDDA
jgi:hypothetical protein